MKTSTLTGADLNRAVNLALGAIWTPPKPGQCGYWTYLKDCQETFSVDAPPYATDIALSWPIIVEKKISTNYRAGTDPRPTPDWRAVKQPDEMFGKVVEATGADPQIAAMRCFVASVFGDDVELP